MARSCTENVQIESPNYFIVTNLKEYEMSEDLKQDGRTDFKA